MPDVRRALPEEMPALADIWHDGWVEAHAAHVPAALSALRVRSDFLERLKGHGDDIRVLGPEGAPSGLCIVAPGEIYQLYVSPRARGSGAASTLILDGEARIKTQGFSEASLDVIPQNTRGRAFYEKLGWTVRERRLIEVYTSQGPFSLPVVTMTKAI